MKRKVIRLTENDLHRIVKSSVKSILKEDAYYKGRKKNYTIVDKDKDYNEIELGEMTFYMAKEEIENYSRETGHMCTLYDDEMEIGDVSEDTNFEFRKFSYGFGGSFDYYE